MKQSIYEKLQVLVERHEEVGHMLGDPEVISDQNKFRDLSQEYAQLEEVVNTFNGYQTAEETQTASEEMLKDEYRERLMEVLRQKIEGEQVVLPESRQPAKVVDLMEARTTVLVRMTSKQLTLQSTTTGGSIT